MVVNYDIEARATYLELVPDAHAKRTAMISDLIMVNLDGAGAPVGVEFLFAPAQITDEMIARVVSRFPELQHLAADRRWQFASA